MTSDLLIALLGFALATSLTPGPNNMMLVSSGVNFGFRRSLPHMFGISLGVVSLVMLSGLGMAGLFRTWPAMVTVLKLLSVGYMLWLAWKIAGSGPPVSTSTSASAGEGAAVAAQARPLTLVQAAGFQWVNPKAWAMALGGIAAYVPHPDLRALGLAALIFALVSIPSTAIWTLAGQGLRRLLAPPRRLRLFNRAMAVLLVASLWPVITLQLAP